MSVFSSFAFFCSILNWLYISGLNPKSPGKTTTRQLNKENNSSLLASIVTVSRIEFFVYLYELVDNTVYHKDVKEH